VSIFLIPIRRTTSSALSGRGPIRLSIPPPEPNRGRRPHKPDVIEVARRLYTTTMLPLREIARRTAVAPSTLSRRARFGGWVRPEAILAAEPVTAAGRRALRRQAPLPRAHK
jgi:DNA invertase Pin-like site-specific DNA recombinase